MRYVLRVRGGYFTQSGQAGNGASAFLAADAEERRSLRYSILDFLSAEVAASPFSAVRVSHKAAKDTTTQRVSGGGRIF